MVYRETRTAGQRLSLIDGFRAGAASLVCWHHFALYGPLADWAAPLADDVLATLRDYGRATQVFFVVGGYLLARQTAGLRHRVPIVVRFLSRRAVRLLLPAVAAMGISMTVCAASRDVLPEATVGRPPTARQVAAHVACLQDILGYESLSAGLWYVPIAMQLTMMFAVMVLLDPTTKTVVGSLLAAVSLSMLGADDAWSVWGIYFFAYFFIGVLAYEAVASPIRQSIFVATLVVMAAVAAAHLVIPTEPHRIISLVSMRLAVAMLAAAVLFTATRHGWITRWPGSRIITRLGETSYSLFLLHFPVLVGVALVWSLLGWSGPRAAILGLCVAYFASLASAEVFHRFVESPAAWLARRL